jgi:stage II sporulation protein D
MPVNKSRRRFLMGVAVLPLARWGGYEAKVKIRVLRTQSKKVETSQLEEYLRGVVPAEMPPDWIADVLYAQVIACRSYAACTLSHPRHSVEGADICDNPVHCQLYQPEAITRRTDFIIEQCANLICTYRGEPALTMYSACCGGHTIDNYHITRDGQSLIPYLSGVPCKCKLSQQPRRGHGIGMCQYGARMMAEAGASYIEILQYYYPGVSIGPLGV